MEQRNAHKLRMCYALFLGLFTAIMGVLYIVSAADIYFSDMGGTGEVYTREIVGQKLSLLLIPSLVWIAAVIGGFVLSVLFPLRASRKKPSEAEVLAKLRRRMPAADGEEFFALRQTYRRAERVRFFVWCACAAVCLLAAVMSAVYLFNTAHFPAADINKEVLAMLKNILPYIGAALLVCCGALVFEGFYARTQLPRMRKLLTLWRGTMSETPPFATQRAAISRVCESETFLVGIRLAVLALGVTLFVLGLFNGGIEDVFRKAVMICTECIGLG